MRVMFSLLCAMYTVCLCMCVCLWGLVEAYVSQQVACCSSVRDDFSMIPPYLKVYVEYTRAEIHHTCSYTREQQLQFN